MCMWHVHVRVPHLVAAGRSEVRRAAAFGERRLGVGNGVDGGQRLWQLGGVEGVERLHACWSAPMHVTNER